MRALDTARMRGASYADVRLVHFKSESVTVRNRKVEGLVVEENMGFGVRVMVDGCWGFASSNDLSAPEADRVAAQAVKIAKASAPSDLPWALPARCADGIGDPQPGFLHKVRACNLTL